MIDSEKILEKLEKGLATFEVGRTQNVGTVVKNTDGVLSVSGLSRAFMGELIDLGGGTLGVVLNLDEDSVSVILLGRGEHIREGHTARTTARILSINVSEDYLGRVVNAQGVPLDGKAKIQKGKDMPLERIAAGVVAREPVNQPLKTGIKALDSMIPIGRGQRELIIGDRGLGKTTIAIDTIINQRQKIPGLREVVCVYVAIGQKQSTIAAVVDRLAKEGAFQFTVVVAASASDQAALWYLAPYSGCAIAEYFMEKGFDVLIVYDDLSKHAWAYRQLSLVLRRPAGREAYPGDIFYLHSRLLERSVKLNKRHGGGSITALPIIETQAGDISSYIPTNIISITDGQIYLQADLFNAGIRPAVNVGLSVSRVGGAAQTPAMKSVSGKLRLELAQYRELAAFAQFGSELDAATQAFLERGSRITEMLKQTQYQPLEESLQILSIFAVTNGYLDDVEAASVGRFEAEFHQYAQTHEEKLLTVLGSGQKLSEETLKKMRKVTESFKKIFQP